MKSVTIYGAGFSGLTLAHHLADAGFAVEIHERVDSPGGMLGTGHTPYGLAERAANAILMDRDLEELFERLDIPLAERKRERKKRYVFWRRPSRWPLRFSTTLRAIRLLLRAKFDPPALAPLVDETVFDWARRQVDEPFAERMVGAAMQGVYGSDGRDLSAELILASLLQKHEPGTRKGSVAPEEGMEQLMRRLADDLVRRGVKIHYHSLRPLESVDGPTVICTSAWAAADLTKTAFPALSARLERCQSLPLVSVTCFFDTHPFDLRGFGCLFPRRQGFNALGVLFNASIFAGRSTHRSETWILGGVGQEAICDLSDGELLGRILEDRAKLQGRPSVEPVAYQFHRWPRAIPHYSVAWARELKTLAVQPPLFLHGNYLGEIGLAKIHRRSKRLAARMKEIYD